ncbi:uncharacterized protein LOC132924085 [Rhopalosiphum padi]|uniref:uncharacterized protein LOC132923184 n=1 Tax=Rhopalosiphum padi TaxID=40932 RepID=UPI00298D6EF3|nr:uncharacterized protein LOC132923184 [Rhopalosiphum padi]XP_060844161.1 uncharacterized protein LOC132924085 [Rhopalosiphum padi]
MTDLKDIYQPKKYNLVENLKTKLNNIIEEKEWEFNDVVEHDYTKPEIIDCLIYYLTGYLSKQLLKYINDCTICKSAFATPQVYSQQLSATLVNMKTKGRLIHPNIFFFNFIQKIEKSFMKHCLSTHVFDLIIDDMINEKHITNFPCVTHGENIISFAVIYYVRMRMRQFTYQENKNKKTENRNKKKVAKFCKT